MRPTSPPSPPTSPTAWNQLAAGILAGDGDALGRWYELEWPTVYRLCFGLLAHHAEAEDCAQDAMLRLSDRIGSWDAQRRYETWRRCVVLNLCRDRKRRDLARNRAERSAGEHAFPSVLPDPAEQAEQGELGHTLGLALAALSEREREAFVLRDLEGEATETVAGIMGIGASSVRSLLTLARRRLRNLMQPCLESGGGSRQDERGMGEAR